MAHYLITGTSSGIGAALCTRLTQAGHQVSGIARRKGRLGMSPKTLDLFHGYQSDVADTTALRGTIDMAISNAGSIDVAILNAGIYQPQDGTRIDPQIYANHMNINYLGVVNALAAIVPNMVQARREAKQVFYKLSSFDVELILGIIFELFCTGGKITSLKKAS